MHKKNVLNLYIMPMDISPEKSYYVYNDTGVVKFSPAEIPVSQINEFYWL